MSEGYSREAYESKANELQEGYEKTGAFDPEKLSDAREVYAQAQTEALAENSARDAEKAAELLKNMHERAEPRIETAYVQKPDNTNNASPEEGLEQIANTARSLDNEEAILAKDRGMNIFGTVGGAGALGFAGFLAADAGLTATGAAIAGLTGVGGAALLGMGGFALYKGFRNWQKRRRFEKQYGSIKTVLAH